MTEKKPVVMIVIEEEEMFSYEKMLENEKWELIFENSYKEIKVILGAVEKANPDILVFGFDCATPDKDRFTHIEMLETLRDVCYQGVVPFPVVMYTARSNGFIERNKVVLELGFIEEFTSKLPDSAVKLKDCIRTLLLKRGKES